MIQPFQKKFAYCWVRKGEWTADAVITKALPSQSYRALRSWITAELSWLSARGWGLPAPISPGQRASWSGRWQHPLCKCSRTSSRRAYDYLLCNQFFTRQHLLLSWDLLRNRNSVLFPFVLLVSNAGFGTKNGLNKYELNEETVLLFIRLKNRKYAVQEFIQ